MAALVKYVMINGSGDYTDLVAGISGILASGVAASGAYDQYYLHLDGSSYSGSFTANVPYSGKLFVNGSGSWFYPDNTCYISGEYPVDLINFTFSDINVIASGMSNNVFSIASGTGFEIDNTMILEAESGILNSGFTSISNSSIHGLGGGYGLKDLGYSVIENSNIAFFTYGVMSDDSTISTSEIYLNTYNVWTSGNIQAIDTLIHGGGSGIVAVNPTSTGLVYLDHVTIDSYVPVWSNGTELNIQRSICYASNVCLVGIYASGSYATSNCLYPSGWTSSNIVGSGNIHQDPLFVDRTNNDYRLKFKQTVGSPAIDMVDKGEVAKSVDLVIDNSQIVIRDHRGFPRQGEFLQFIYRQGSTLMFSDYGRETSLASLKNSFRDLTYEVYTRAEFTASGISLTPSFTYNPELVHAHPWDWDYKTFETTEITDEHRYIIPRTMLDVVRTISGYIGNLTTSTIFSSFTKESIRPYMHYDYRGVAFDYDLSSPGEAILWMVEGQNQHLIQLNAFSTERYRELPLSVPVISGRSMIRPSGLIPAGVYKDGYRYIVQDNPSIDLIAETEDGLFKWIATDLDVQKDFRGVLAYKDKLYLTATEYNIPIYDRTIIPTTSGLGKLVMYDNNNNFEHYITNYTTTKDYRPVDFILASGNKYPTDLTIYEDGKVYISDYSNNDEIFIYEFAYDYALIRGNYDEETSILLRENYPDVQI